MSWDKLFDDLQAQFEAVVRQDESVEVPHLAEAEAAGIVVADRIRACAGQELTVRMRDGSTRVGKVQEATRSWVRLADGARSSVIPLTAVVAAWPLRGSAPEPGRIEARVTLGHALRALAQQRVAVFVHTEAGDHRGVVVQVGADHLDLLANGTVLTILWSGLLSIDSV